MNFIIFTNNSWVNERYGDKYNVNYFDCSFDEIFEMVRDKIHQGHTLLSHPLSGSVKPNETPFKSVMISAEPKKFDVQSLEIIEDAIVTAKKFEQQKRRQAILNDRVKEDFRMIDFYLITSAIESAQLGI